MDSHRKEREIRWDLEKKIGGMGLKVRRVEEWEGREYFFKENMTRKSGRGIQRR
jgi:hypothetical protein